MLTHVSLYSYLIKTVIADLSLLAVCQGFGFVGGQIFPTMFAGYLCGIIAYDRYTPLLFPCSSIPSHILCYYSYDVAFDVAVPCLMCAVPCAFVPTPFTFVFMVAILFGNYPLPLLSMSSLMILISFEKVWMAFIPLTC